MNPIIFIFIMTVTFIMFLYQPRRVSVHMSQDMFFEKLKWKLANNEIRDFTRFCVDVYCFRFEEPLSQEMSTDFTGLAERLEMKEVRAVMILFVWLCQHDVKFSLVFRWNSSLPVWYNLRHMMEPHRVRKTLQACGHDDIMSCPLEILVEKLYGKDDNV